MVGDRAWAGWLRGQGLVETKIWQAVGERVSGEEPGLLSLSI